MSDHDTGHYQTLGLQWGAGAPAVKKAYFALVRKYPPETHPEEFQRVREAYEVLSNPQSRADYDSVNEYDKYGANRVTDDPITVPLPRNARRALAQIQASTGRTLPLP